jgi:hypothetical protein
VVRFGLDNRGGESSRSSRSGGSEVRIAARPAITVTEYKICLGWYSQDRIFRVIQGPGGGTVDRPTVQYVPKLVLPPTLFE